MPGVVYRWLFYAANPGQVYLQIWRRTPGRPEAFTLIGQVSKTCTQEGVYELSGAEAGNIRVKVGDILGFWIGHEDNKNLIPFVNGVCGTAPRIYERERQRSPPIVGQTYKAELPTHVLAKCRVYSIQIEIGLS